MNSAPSSLESGAGNAEPNAKWSAAVRACLDNGTRLFEDAKYLVEYGRFPTARAIAILAQEEFAKAYLLRLVADGAIPDCDEVVRACRDHVCKHLVSVIMLHLYVPIEDIGARVAAWSKPRIVPTFPSKVADAINILCHEKLLRWNNPYSTGLDDYDYDDFAKRVWKGAVDRAKQDVLYVSVGKAGLVLRTPICTGEEAEAEILTTSMLKEIAEGHDVFASEEKHQLREVLQVMLEKLAEVKD